MRATKPHRPNVAQQSVAAVLVLAAPAAYAHGYGDLAVFVVFGLFLLGGVGIHILVGIILLAMSKFASLKWLVPPLIWSGLCIVAWVLVFGVTTGERNSGRIVSLDGSTAYEFQGTPFMYVLPVAIAAVILALIVGPVVQYLRARRAGKKG